jgi:hypothetical protein
VGSVREFRNALASLAKKGEDMSDGRRPRIEFTGAWKKRNGFGVGLKKRR